MFKSLQEVGLKVNLEKCAFGRKFVKFLGHIVGSGKHSPDPEKDIPWESSAEESFVRLKEELVKMPSLHAPDLSRPFLLFTDASAAAIGACLAQHNDHMEEMPIAFFSKKLTLSQTKWSTIEREAFSVLEALRKFDTWIFGSQIQVVSDHDPLTYVTNSAPHSAKLTRWALALQRYNVKVSYRKGSASRQYRCTF
ncbi:retrovirus-related Pol polyprotein from transposon 297 [Trichonephila clavipes]|nr:retrovirus-related Pol polyprotein from transposon 297 [Trichonephila clavipes]